MSLLKAQVKRDLLKRDFLDRLDGLDREVRKLKIGAVEGSHVTGALLPGIAYVGDKPMISADAAGNMRLGSDLDQPSGTHLSIFGNDGTYNSESVGAGDLLIGDNSASKANILWDRSAGQLKIRGGTTTRSYISTDGSIRAGGGVVILDDNGLTLQASDLYDNGADAITFHSTGLGIDGAFIKGTLWEFSSLKHAQIVMQVTNDWTNGVTNGTNEPRFTLAYDQNGVGWTKVSNAALFIDTTSTSHSAGDLAMAGSIIASTAVGCRAKRTSARTGLAWNTWYNLTPASDTATGCFDNDGMWQSGWDYLKINTPGIYAVGMWLNAGNSNSSGNIEAKLFINSTEIASTYFGRNGWDSITLTSVAKFSAAQKFYAKYQYQGGSGTLSVGAPSAMWAVRVA
jgi:hypothetical protein